MKTTDYIDRKRAANFLCKIICGSDRELCVSTPENCQQKRMMEFFELPVADVVPVVHGEWEYDQNAGDWGIGGYICSVCKNKNNNLPCNRIKSASSFFGAKYCPNCGAKMSSE